MCCRSLGPACSGNARGGPAPPLPISAESEKRAAPHPASLSAALGSGVCLLPRPSFEGNPLPLQTWLPPRWQWNQITRNTTHCTHPQEDSNTSDSWDQAQQKWAMMTKGRCLLWDYNKMVNLPASLTIKYVFAASIIQCLLLLRGNQRQREMILIQEHRSYSHYLGHSFVIWELEIKGFSLWFYANGKWETH